MARVAAFSFSFSLPHFTHTQREREREWWQEKGRRSELNEVTEVEGFGKRTGFNPCSFTPKKGKKLWQLIQLSQLKFPCFRFNHFSYIPS